MYSWVNVKICTKNVYYPPFFTYYNKKFIVEVKKVGIINAWNDWMNARYEKRVSRMEAKGLCPDCSGRGFNTYGNEYYFGPQFFNCPGCDGTGSFQNWQGNNE